MLSCELATLENQALGILPVIIHWVQQLTLALFGLFRNYGFGSGIRLILALMITRSNGFALAVMSLVASS